MTEEKKYDDELLLSEEDTEDDAQIEYEDAPTFGTNGKRKRKESEQQEASVQVKEEKKLKDPVDLSTKTLKVSEPVLAEIQSLKPIIKEVKDLNRATVNDVIHTLVEFYVDNALEEKHQTRYANVFEAFFPQ